MSMQYKATQQHEAQYRRALVSELYRKGNSLNQVTAIISEKLRPGAKPYCKATICADLKRIRQEWRTARLSNMDEKVEHELAVIDQAEAAAWEGWERSIGKYTVKTQETGGGPQGPVNKESIKTEHLAGDPRFLQMVQDCIDKRCKILGLYAAIKSEVDVTGKALFDMVAKARERLQPPPEQSQE